MAQLVARLNGIQKVRGSNPLGSTKKYRTYRTIFFCLRQGIPPRFYRGVALQQKPLRADASFCEQVHPLRYYGSVLVASYVSPYLHQKNNTQT